MLKTFVCLCTIYTTYICAIYTKKFFYFVYFYYRLRPYKMLCYRWVNRPIVAH